MWYANMKDVFCLSVYDFSSNGVPVMEMSRMIIEPSKVVWSWANKNNKADDILIRVVVLVGLEGKSSFVIVIVCWAPDPQFFQVFEAERRFSGCMLA